MIKLIQKNRYCEAAHQLPQNRFSHLYFILFQRTFHFKAHQKNADAAV